MDLGCSLTPLRADETCVKEVKCRWRVRDQESVATDLMLMPCLCPLLALLVTFLRILDEIEESSETGVCGEREGRKEELLGLAKQKPRLPG